MKKVLVDLTVKEVQQLNANCVLLVMKSDVALPPVYPGQFAELRNSVGAAQTPYFGA